jgi:hypothetical protein
MNRTAKLLGVSTPSVLAWIEQFAKDHAQKPEPLGRALVIELDEIWHLSQKKLARQSWLAKLVLDCPQEGLRVAAEATA